MMDIDLMPLFYTALITPFAAAAGKWLLNYVQSWIDATALKSDPLYDLGSVFVSLHRGSTKLMNRCYVHSIGRGRVEIRGLLKDGRDDGEALSFSVREFMALDPYVLVPIEEDE